MKTLRQVLGEQGDQEEQPISLVGDDENNETDDNKELQRIFVALHPVLKTKHPHNEKKPHQSDLKGTEIPNTNQDPMKTVKVSESLSIPSFDEYLIERKKKKGAKYEDEKIIVKEDAQSDFLKKTLPNIPDAAKIKFLEQFVSTKNLSKSVLKQAQSKKGRGLTEFVRQVIGGK